MHGTLKRKAEKMYLTPLILPDIDVDSDNDNGTDAPEEDAYEDSVEADDLTVTPNVIVPGKVIPVNDDDDDDDDVVDYLDGFNLTPLPEDDGNADEDDFFPVVLKLFGDITPDTLIRFSYSCAAPDLPANQGPIPPSGYDSRPYSTSGGLRLWTTDSATRNGNPAWDGGSEFASGDFVPPEWYYAGEVDMLDGYQVFYMEGIEVGVYTIKVEVDMERDGTWDYEDEVKVTVTKPEFVDNIPDYCLDANMDSDNHFFRKNNDHEDLDVYYKIMPIGVPVDDVKIKVYKGDTSTVLAIIPGETDASGNFKTGNGLHVTWTAPDTLGAADPGFYRLQIQVFVGGVSTPIYETGIDDADASEPDWQCPNDCLAIHDIVYKHRPVLNIASGEISEPVSYTFALSRSKIYEWQYNALLGIWLPGVKASNPVSLSDMSTYSASQYWFGFVDADDRSNPPAWDMQIYHVDYTSGDYVFLQYWMYCATSYLPVGNAPDVWWHEGDWEMCQCTVKLRDASNPSDKSKWYEPFAVTCSQHYYGQTLKWKAEVGDSPPSSQNQDHVEKTGTQPVLYVALKSHAIYFRAGEFKTKSGAPVGSQHQYEVPTTLDISTDITGAAATLVPDTSDLVYINKDPIINNWGG